MDREEVRGMACGGLGAWAGRERGLEALVPSCPASPLSVAMMGAELRVCRIRSKDSMWSWREETALSSSEEVNGRLSDIIL